MSTKKSISFTDTYASKYRYGNRYPTGINYGEKICKYLDSNEWVKESIKMNISEMNDNRMDRFYGFNSTYEHKETKKKVQVYCDISATGKTKKYIFSSFDVENEEELKILLHL